MNETHSSRMEFHRFDYAAFLTFGTYAAGSVAVPVVLVQLAASLNFPLDAGGMSAGGGLHLGRTLSMIVLLLVSGFIGGRYGIRRSLGAFVLLMACGVGLCALTPNYFLLFLGLLLAGCGEGYIEAMGTPFVQMLHPVDTGKYMNFTHGFWSIGIFTSVLLAGWLLILGVHWRWILGLIALLGIVPAFLLLVPQKKGHEFPEKFEKQDFRTVWQRSVEIMRCPRFWFFFAAMFLAGGGEFCLTFWLASFMQLSLKANAFLGGVATAVFAAGMAVGRTGFGMLVPQKKLYSLLMWCSVLGIVTGIILPLLTSTPLSRIPLMGVLFLMLFLIGIATAPFWPTIQTYAVDRLPSTLDTTLIFILLSAAGVPGCGVFTFLMGLVGDLGGLTVSFYLVPVCYLIMLLLLAAERLAGKKTGV